MNKRLKEIEKRLAEIKAEIETPGADMTALDNEVESLLEERKGILEQMQQRKTTLARIAAGDEGVSVPVVHEEQERSYGADSKEYRSAFLKKIRGLEMNDVEKRAFSSASNSAGAVLPTQTANEVIKKLTQYAPLLGEITLLHVAGNVKFAVEGTIADAAKHSENGSITAASDTLVEVSLTSYEINKLVQVSKTVATMSIDAFETWLVDMIAQKVAEQIGAYLINGTGSSQPQGIEKAQTWGAENSVTVAKAGALTAENVLSLIGLLPGGYDKNAKFLMSKKTLFTDLMPLQDKSKNDLVVCQNGSYFVYGYPVMLDDNVALHEAYLGDFKKVVGNLSEDINVVSGFDIDSNSFKYLGSAMFDSKVAIGEAFVKLVKATS